MITFHPMPRTFVHPYSHDSTYQDLVEVEVPVGKTCRYLALGTENAHLVTVHLEEGNAGLPGSFFEAHPLGPNPEMRGGYLGEHVGPTKLRFWLSGRGIYPMEIGGALCFEDSGSESEEKNP